jgi:guanine nucleotide-binding protein subunit alpha
MMRSKHSLSRRRSLSDPLSKALQPPPDESPAARDRRLKREAEAKKVSDDIDEMIKHDRAQLKKQKQAVKILLLGQSESGKSTTLKREFDFFPK